MKRVSFVDARFVQGFVEFRNRFCLSMLAHNVRFRYILRGHCMKGEHTMFSGLCFVLIWK